MDLEVLSPHGLCAGVNTAVAVAMRQRNAYCLHHLVHNEIVIGDLESLGYKFVDDIEEVPDCETVVFSAHGVSPHVRERALEKHLNVIDATCPFVAHAHKAAREFSERGLPVVVLGDPAHVEVQGILGELKQNREPLLGEDIGVICQTTLNSDEVNVAIDALRKQYNVVGIAGICTATRERQEAVRNFKGDALLVLGSRESANTRRLCEVAHCPVFLAGNMNEVKIAMEEMERYEKVGITSGASTPERFFSSAVNALRRIPAHIAIIMDGNGRWAVKRGKPRRFGHVAGSRTLVKAIEWLGARGIDIVSVYAFSTENWKRPHQEVAGLMRIFTMMLASNIDTLIKNQIRLRVAGRRGDLPPRLQKAIADAEQRTAQFKRQLIVCISYGGRAEIVDAVNAAIERGEKVTEETFRRYLYLPDVPDPDLVIRTGGEKRTSNFLLWESAYAEYHFTETLWPDFSPRDLDEALEAYSTRHRRKGGL